MPAQDDALRLERDERFLRVRAIDSDRLRERGCRRRTEDRHTAAEQLVDGVLSRPCLRCTAWRRRNLRPEPRAAMNGQYFGQAFGSHPYRLGARGPTCPRELVDKLARDCHAFFD